jgi:rhomboid protease GluP
MANVVVAAAAFGCAIYFYRFSLQKPKPPFPIVTILIIGVTSLTTGLQFVFPEILSDFRRNREALWAGEWWRMVTPLFVQAAGWKQCCVNGVAAVVFCPLAEKLYGNRLFALYFIPGVLGEIFAYAWSPNGAGSSLGIAGVVGSLFAYTYLYRQGIPALVHILAMVGFAGAVAFSFFRDNHGPPILIGGLLAGLMTRLWPNNEMQRKEACKYEEMEKPLT